MPDSQRQQPDPVPSQHQQKCLELFQQVWEQLCEKKAVHVDSVLGGSGSSRNQPETILANLPYVEWLPLNGKKHISYVGKPTHALGTLKQMDNLAAQALRDAIRAAQALMPAAIIVVENTRSISSCLESVSGLPPTAVASGIYRHTHTDREIWVVNSSTLAQPLPLGVYVVIPAKAHLPGSASVTIARIEFSLVVRDGVNLLTHIA